MPSLTADIDNKALFSANLIPAQCKAELPRNYSIRPLQRDDYARGHLEPLRDLTHVGDILEAQWIERFDWMLGCAGTYYTIVIVDEGRNEGNQIVATGTLIVEKKFLFKLGTQGHIEDIAVIKDQQGKRLGLRLLQTLNYIAKEVGCYKAILDCSARNIGFYEKCGYETAGHEMCCFFDEEAKQRGV